MRIKTVAAAKEQSYLSTLYSFSYHNCATEEIKLTPKAKLDRGRMWDSTSTPTHIRIPN